jgi:predicted TIM-barrel fold metal-dependent hydrolase
MNEPFYNSHIHIFKGDQDVPDKFLPLGLVRWFAKRDHPVFNWIMHNLNPLTDNDTFDKYLQFVRIGKLGSQENIFNECFKNYPKDTKFIVLPMDMAYMKAGKTSRPYEEQLIELKNLSSKYPKNIIPFVHIDCRREGYFDLFKKAIEEWGYKGLKLYPPLGVFPYDPRYDCIYDYCEKNNLPVIAHCTDGNPVFYKGSYKELNKLLEGCKLDIDWSKSNKELCSYFTHPLGYKFVMDKHPNLKISLAHFGRQTEWDGIIKDMMEVYPNLYTDVSYSMYNEDNWAPLKINLITNDKLRNHCLFGSDFYMNAIECTEKQFDIKFRAYLGEELWSQISTINPTNFLGK